MNTAPTIRIGTRASKLALAQAEMVRAGLLAAHPGMHTEIVAMTTAGDRELHKTLADWGYKGLFTRELEEALTSGAVDIAVHSMKDMPSVVPEGLAIGAILPRAEVRDAWISPHYAALADAPPGVVIGTSSTRRAAQLRYLRPDVQIVEFRGNLQTRLRKLEEGLAAATFLAAAGLQRLGLGDHIRALLPLDDFLPAAAQGAVGVEYVADRSDIATLLVPLNHSDTADCVTSERAMLRVLDGSCRTPIGGLATLQGDTIKLIAEVLAPDGSKRHRATISGDRNDAITLGENLGAQLRAEAGEGMLRYV